MDKARVTTIVRAEAEAGVGSGPGQSSERPADYVGRHARRPAPAPAGAIARHPRGHGFSILSRLARADHLTSAAV